MSSPSLRKIGAFFTIIICLVLTGLSYWAIVNKQLIIDQITIWQYKPSNDILQLSDRSGMGSYGKFLFLASQPMLAKSTDEIKTFNSVCNDVERTASILGCYSNYQIYLYNVTDAQLDGVKEATAVHETLHAAYLRLGDEEKNRIDVLLEAEAEKLTGSKEFKDRMAYYARTEPGQRDNELHSVIGTEVANISPELEAYYKKYFIDRQKIVSLNSKYIKVFDELAKKASDLMSQLNLLAADITSSSEKYNADTKQLNADITEFNTNASSGNFTSQAQFRAQRSALSARVEELSVDKNAINNMISKYDTILAEYNSIASQSKKLNNSLDSTLAPTPSV